MESGDKLGYICKSNSGGVSMMKSELMENGTLIRTYSDAGMKIRQVETGTVYDEAVDVPPLRYAYEETDEPVDQGEESELDELREYYDRTQAVLPG